jgi:hypothetical protein
MLKTTLLASVLVGLVCVTAGNASASTFDKRTLFTFGQPVALPGVTLPAGTYVFRLADPVTSRKVIQVTDEQGTMSYALLNTTEARRAEPTMEPEVRFIETPAGAPAPVSAWWYPGESLGYQFIYPKGELAALTRGNLAQPAPAASVTSPTGGEPVAVPPIADTTSSHDVVEGGGVPAEADQGDVETQVARAEPPAEPVPEAQAPAQPQEPPSDVSNGAREQLPQTASPLALLLLGGLTTASLGARMLRKS